MYTIYYDDRVDFYSLWEFLNKLNDENKELKEEKKEFNCQCNLLREQANEFHHIALENGNRVGQLEKENEQLKKERLTWLKSQEELECLSEENKELKQTIDKIKESIEYLKDKGGDVTLADVDGTLNKIDEIANGDNDDRKSKM